MSDMCYRCMQPEIRSGRCRVCGARAKERNSPEDHDILPPGTMLDGGKIMIGESLGRGGFGITYIARDEESGQVIALKEFFPKHLTMRNGNDVVPLESKLETYEKCRRDFKREARLINSLYDHPHVVNVYFTLEENNTCYYGMELLKGQSLSAYLTRRGAMSMKEAITLLDPIMDALTRMHAQKMLHRDISPDNIYLREVPGGYSPCLIDFGAAYSARADFTQSMPRVRNMYFSPPDQNFSVEHQGPPMDVYALCATLYYMVTGKPPVSADERMVDGSAIIPITTHVPRLPEELWKIINQGMSLERAKRFQTMDELRTRLNALIGKTPERSKPVPAPEPPAPPDPVPKPEPPAPPKPPVPEPPRVEREPLRHLQLIGCILEWLVFYGLPVLCLGSNWLAGIIIGFCLMIVVNTILLALPVPATIGQRLLGIGIPPSAKDSPNALRVLFSVARAFVPYALVDEVLVLCGVYPMPLVWQLHRSDKRKSAEITMDCLELLDTEQLSTGEIFILTLGPQHDVTIGRGSSMVTPNARLVSRQHCVIRQGSDGPILVDKEATNGTWINNERIAPGASKPLKEGDVIALAKQVYLRYRQMTLRELKNHNTTTI